MPALQQAPPFNPKIVISFVNAVRTVFSTMVGLTTTVGSPSLKAEPAPCYDVSGIVGFSGAVEGSVVISFQTDAALKIVEAFAGNAIAINHPDFPDAVGELANMIAGNAKKDLGGRASITCPSVIIGPGHTVARLRDVPCVVIPCHTPAGDIAIEISIKQVASVE